jgi:5'-nucleotidase (lipoprotein e(P4) family)
MRKIILLLYLALIFSSCANKHESNNPLPENQDPLLLSVLWYQKSPEMQALYYQCYNNATKSLDEKLRKNVNGKPEAVIMDIDETILDNSQVEAYQVVHNVAYSDSLWNRWTDLAIAEPLPGALEFTLYAKSKGVEVFYVTNRSRTMAYESTLKNLRDKGFPFADSLHLMAKTTTSLKGERRQEVALKYEILLFIGDNIGDFDNVFDNRDTDLGFGAVIRNKDSFGDRFIILPNPMYGPWINAAIKNSTEITTREKLINALKSF